MSIVKCHLDFYEGEQGKALKVLVERLWSAGFEAYLAGGCVRDRLMGRSFKDIDIATDASPIDVQRLFEKTIPVGEAFGIIRVWIEGFEFEVARFRKDGEYKDGRHPEKVEFASPHEDALRRDFTVNALFYDLKNDEVLDYVGGLNDMRSCLLRTVGSPDERFSEDYLRILRLIRFSIQLKFTIEDETKLAAQRLIKHLKEVSSERLASEITKAIQSDASSALALFDEWGLSELLVDPVLAIERTEGEKKVLCFSDGAFPMEAGGVFALWILYFYRRICLRSVRLNAEFEATEWYWTPEYESLIESMCLRFRLSKKAAQNMKRFGTLLSWNDLWFHIRLGVRAQLAQTEMFRIFLNVHHHSPIWSESVFKEIAYWSSESLQTCFLVGQDLFHLEPTKRGGTIKECLCLQYEGALTSREAALDWLRGRV